MSEDSTGKRISDVTSGSAEDDMEYPNDVEYPNWWAKHR
jgi:hypothetical protein